MPEPHPLDRLVWSALTGPQRELAGVHGRARRFDPDFAIFAAVEQRDSEALADLAALVAAQGPVYLMEPQGAPSGPGLNIISEAAGVQMVAEVHAPAAPETFEIVPLGDADGPEMLALATLTKPGPFFTRTHQLGDFVGVKHEGRLVAMAGERLKAAGYAEVSGVCTHPDFRGRGYAAGLMRRVMAAIRARGDIPILHAYASNTGAIALYETLGFRLRTEVVVTALAPA